MAVGHHIEKRFWLYLGAILTDWCEIWIGNKESHVNTGHVTKTAIFENSRCRTAAILKIALSPYLSRELSNFDQIWYTDTNFHSEHATSTKIENFQIQDGGRTPYWTSFFGYISAPYLPINAKFGSKMKNHMPIQGTWPKLQFYKIPRRRTAAILKIALSPYLSRELSDFNQIWQTDVHFNSHDGHLTKKSKFCKFKMADGRHIENRFLAISRRHIDQLMRHLDRKYTITWSKLQFYKIQDGGRPPFSK